MILISAVRLRNWIPWLVRFVFIMVLIYVLTAAFGWFESRAPSHVPAPVTAPTLFAGAGSLWREANMASDEGMAVRVYGTQAWVRG